MHGILSLHRSSRQARDDAPLQEQHKDYQGDSDNDRRGGQLPVGDHVFRVKARNRDGNRLRILALTRNT